MPEPQDRGILGLEDREILDLFIPLYGRWDSTDYRGETMESHLNIGLKMRQTNESSAIYYWEHNGKLSETTCVYVEDLLIAGDTLLQAHT